MAAVLAETAGGWYLETHSGEREAPAREDAFLLHVQELVTPQQFNTWFRHITLEELRDQGVRLLVPNLFVRDWVSNYYSDILALAVRRAFGEDRSISLAVDPLAPPPPRLDVATTMSMGTQSVATPMFVDTLDRSSDTVLHEDYTFANFVVGSSNRFAYAAASAVAEAPGKSYNPFFLHGSVGLGKTHLLQAVCHQILERDPSTLMLYLSCEAFINQFISSLENNALSTFRHKYRNVDVLLIDDIHLLANKERTQEEFFHTFNTLYNLGRQIVLTSDAPPKEIPTLQERLVSRFKMGMVVEVGTPDFETRVNILRNKARLRGQTLPDDVAHFTAENVSTNIRELEGAVVRLLAYSSLVKQPLNVELAREVLADSMSTRTTAISIQDVVSIVTRFFNVKLSDLQSKRRNQSIAYPRQIGMYLARKHTRLSLEEIGGYFGGRDHTTVLYAIEKIKKMIDREAAKADLIHRLERDIGL